MIRNERGAALPLVFILSTALFIIGTALLGVSVSQASRTMFQEKKEQAFYIAKSGADAVASYMIDNYNPVTLTEKAIDELNQNFGQEVTLGNGTFSAEIKKGPHDTIVIHSQGTVGNITNQVSLRLGLDEPRANMENAIMAEDYIENTGGFMVCCGADVVARESIRAGTSNIVGGELKPQYKGEFPPKLDFPNTADWPEVPIGAVINQSGYYGEYNTSPDPFTAQPPSPETFAIHVTDSKDMHIVFNDFKSDKDPTITIGGGGTGIIHIYAHNIKVAGAITIKNSQKKKVILHVRNSIELAGSFNLDGVLLYAPEAEYTSTNGALILTGAMVVNNLSLNGASTVTYDATIANLINETRKFKRIEWSGG